MEHSSFFTKIINLLFIKVLHVSYRLDHPQAYKNSNIFAILKVSPGRKFWGSEKGTSKLKRGGAVAHLQIYHSTPTCSMSTNLGRDMQLASVYKSSSLEKCAILQ
jgi:hypothetical protein